MSKFNDMFDLAGLQKDIASLAEKQAPKKEFVDVPVGVYEVCLMSLELKESKKGMPMVSARMKIVSGEYEGQSVFMNQVLTQGFHFSIVNRILEALETDLEIKFVDFDQYEELLKSVLEVATYEFAIDLSERNGFKVINVIKTFKCPFN